MEHGFTRIPHGFARKKFVEIIPLNRDFSFMDSIGLVRIPLDGLTERVIGAVFEVARTLGTGFLEKVYEKAMVTELGLRGMRVRSQVPIPVFYKGEPAGEYFADNVEEDELVVELKCVEQLCQEHTAQCLNYSRASGRNVCLMVNFQRAPVQWERVVLRFD